MIMNRKIQIIAVRATGLLIPIVAIMLILVPSLTGVLRALGLLIALLMCFYVLARPESAPLRPSREDYRNAFLSAFVELADEPQFADRLADVAASAQAERDDAIEDLRATVAFRAIRQPGDLW